MNKTALSLDLKNTYYTITHGLPNRLNRSNCVDQCILTNYANKLEKFKKICST